MYCLLPPQVEHMNICDPPIQLQGYTVHMCMQGHSQQWSPNVILTRQTLAMFPHVCRLHCDVSIQISRSNEKRSWLLAAIGMNLRSGRRAAPMRMLWGTGDHLSLDWELVSWFFNLKRPSETQSDVPCTLLYVCTRLPSHLKKKPK